MRLEGITLKKTCSFYISDFHLSTLLLPYITNKIRNDIQIVTFFEKDIEENIKKVLKIMDIGEYIKEEVSKLKWSKTELKNNLGIFENLEFGEKDCNIIVAGEKAYIEYVNKKIVDSIKNVNKESLKYKTTVTINNCYYVEDVLNVNEILNEHDLLLNTSGEVKIDSVYNKC